MAFDGFFVSAMANELARDLSGARIERINCRGEAVEFTMYVGKTKKYLYISLAPSANFIALYDNPTLANDAPTPICLLLRKHIAAGKVVSIEHIKNERIIKFVFDSPDELGHISEKTLYAEIMGKYSNLILTSGGKVLGGLHSADLVSFKRAIMPGFDYELPPAQEKISAEYISDKEFEELCASQTDKNCSRFLVDNFFCFSPLSAFETVYYAGGDEASSVADIKPHLLFKSVKRLYDYIQAGNYKPTSIMYGDGQTEYWIDEIHRFPDGTIRSFSSLSEMVGTVFGEKAEKNILRERTSDLSKIVSQRLKRLQKKLALQTEELEKCAEKDICRLRGELITANIYRIKQGMTSVICNDWNTGEDITITLDKRLSPSANAEMFFKKYRKYKTAETEVAKQMAECGDEICYLESVADCIERCRSGEEAELIREELVVSGYIRGAKTQGKKIQRKPCKPIEYTTSGGYAVKVGRNNLMNDALTKSAEKDDLWFHVKKYPGSHVVMYAAGSEPGEADYTEAAAIAAYHSSVRGNHSVEVDYTRVRYLKKPAASKPGFVTYEKYWSALVPADGSLIKEK